MLSLNNGFVNGFQMFLDLLLRPLVVFAVMSALALFIIGPVFHTVESYVLAGTEWILALPFGLAGLVLGGIHQIIVVTGVHHVFNLLEANLISNTGKDPLNAIITSCDDCSSWCNTCCWC